MNPLDSRLLKDLDRLTKRVNSEEGVPMFLACEDLAPGVVTGQLASVASRDLNDAFVSTFLQDVDFVQSARPDARLTDIAKIVERLAERDFAIDGGERRS